MLDYANSDLVCYRADRPPDLVQRQTESWDPVLDWARTDLDAPFEMITGVIHRSQPPAALAAHRAAVKALNDFELAAYHSVMTLTGSVARHDAGAPGDHPGVGLDGRPCG